MTKKEDNTCTACGKPLDSEEGARWYPTAPWMPEMGVELAEVLDDMGAKYTIAPM